MTFKQRLRAQLPQDLLRLYTRAAHPAEMAEYRRLRAVVPRSAEDISLKPFVERRAIFFHIPKCAGLSVSRELFGCRGGGHMGLHAYRHAFTAREFARFYKFTFVRNPWDRLVSAYFFLKDGGLNADDRQSAEASITRFPDFTAFVEDFIAREDFGRVLHLRSQHSFLCTSPESPPAVDFIGRFERIAEDFATVSRALGLNKVLPRHNAGASRPEGYRQLYTDRTAEIVAQAYARDIALFGYSF